MADGREAIVATNQALRTPRAAAIAGIIFSLLLLCSLILVRTFYPAEIDNPGVWPRGGSRGLLVVALTLIPFAGIAFLWFMGVIRDRIGVLEDRFFATVFLGSGLLFVAMLFTSSALAAGLLTAFGSSNAPATGPAWSFGRSVTHTVLTVYAMKMAGVFTVSTTTIIWRTGLAPGWLTVSGYLSALVLLLGSGLVPWLELVFPLWVLLLSVYILLASPRQR